MLIQHNRELLVSIKLLYPVNFLQAHKYRNHKHFPKENQRMRNKFTSPKVLRLDRAPKCYSKYVKYVMLNS